MISLFPSEADSLQNLVLPFFYAQDPFARGVKRTPIKSAKTGPKETQFHITAKSVNWRHKKRCSLFKISHLLLA